MFRKKLKRIGAWMLTMSMLFGAVSFPSVRVHAADSENSAVSATATASSVEAGSTPASKVNDGDSSSKSSRWSSARGAGPQWIQLQWDAPQTMKNIVLYWERRNVENYRLEVSSDGQNWNDPIWSNTGYPKKNKEIITLDAPVTGSYLRLYIETVHSESIDPSETSWDTASLYEIEVYSDEIPDRRTEAQKVADEIEKPEVAEGDTKLSMPENLPEGAKVRFCADYEEVVDEDGTIYTPISQKTVKGFYEVTLADESSARTEEFTITVPGQYTESESSNAKPAVIPELQEWHGGTGRFLVKADSKIVVGDDALFDVAGEFAKDYKEITGMEIEVISGNWMSVKMGDFYLSLTDDTNGLGKEGYTLSVHNSVFVEAEEATGAYWATRTILQILKQTSGSMPKGLIRDYPKFEVRGFSLDVARKPISLDALYAFAKNMSWYKMNNFQVHLSDNLIFMEDYPTIEQAIEETYAGFRLESGVVNPDTNKSATSEDVSYTKDEFRTFIQDSRTIGVSIIPELDMPAHALPFTRAFPEFMTVKTGIPTNRSRHIIDELNLEKEGAYDLAKRLWQDYFDGENPVFDKETIIHIGTDEFHGKEGQEGIEMFRRFSDEMIKYIQNTGRTVRMWGSLSNKRGETPVAVDDVQLNVWNTGYSVPSDMHKLGYDLINTLDGSLYVVPSGIGKSSRGGYGDYLNTTNLYNNWQANNLGGYIVPAGDDQMLGACYAVWHDNIDTRANGIAEYDSFDRFFDALPMMSAKLWGDAKDRNLTDFTALISETGTAPDTNMYAELDFVTNTAADWTFDDTLTADASVNKNDLTEVKNAEQTEADNNSKAISLKGGESYAETPLDQVGSDAVITMRVKKEAGAEEDSEQILCESKDSFGNIGTYALKASVKQTGNVGFSREGYTYSFNYTLPVGEWVELEFHSGQKDVALYVNGRLVDDRPTFYYDNHPDVERSEQISNANAMVRTMMVPIGRIGSKTDSFKGQIDYVKVTGSKEVSGEEATSQILQNKVQEYPDTLAAGYTDGSWKILVKARQEAQAVIEHADSTAEDFTLAYEKLQGAAAKLEQKPADYDQTVENFNQIADDLKDAVKEIDMENLDSYTEETVSKIQAALSSVKSMLQNPNVTAEDIKDALKVIKDIQLVTKAEEAEVNTARGELKTEITAAEAKLKNTAGYTKDSVDALKKAIADAKAVADREDATLKELKDALAALKGKTLIKDTPKTDTSLKDNDPFEVNGVKYQVVSAAALTAKLIKGKDVSNVKINTVSYQGKTYKIVEIGAKAYNGCKKKLKKVTIGANVAKIGKDAFKGCKKLTNVIVQNKSKLKSVGGGAFKKTSAKIKIKLPKTLKKNKKLKAQIKKAGIKKGL